MSAGTSSLASRPDAGAPVDPTHLIEVLSDVEEIPQGATGALVFGPRDEPDAMVLVEGGRVCWAVAAGMRRRMTDILREQATPPVEVRAIEAVYRRCCADASRPLGEALLAAGIVDERGLRRALERHTVEAIARLGAAPPRAPAWIDRRRKGYDARFTFAPIELLVAVGAQTFPDSAAEGKRALARMLSGGGRGVAWVRHAATAAPWPVAVTEGDALTVGAVRALARWSTDALDLARAISPRADLAIASRADGAAAVAWSGGGLLFAAACDEPSAVASVVVQRARARARAEGA